MYPHATNLVDLPKSGILLDAVLSLAQTQLVGQIAVLLSDLEGIVKQFASPAGQGARAASSGDDPRSWAADIGLFGRTDELS